MIPLIPGGWPASIIKVKVSLGRILSDFFPTWTLYLELDQREKVMRVVEQHVSGKSNVLSPRISVPAIPWRRVALYMTLSLGFFLLGFVPMWLKASAAIEQRDAAQRGVRLAQLQNTLGAAMVDVQRGDFEPARQLTSDFYSNLRTQVDGGGRSVFTAIQREKIRPLLAERDDLITLLARSDPEAADRLFAIYSSYNKLTSNGR